MRKDTQNLWNLVEPYVKDAGFELVEVQSGREPTGWLASRADAAWQRNDATEVDASS